MSTLPEIYTYGEVENTNFYVRDLFIPISDELSEKIGEETDDINEFFFSKVNDVRKSQTNLENNFDSKFLDFLNELKKDLKLLSVGNNFDIAGISLNIYLDENDNYILADF